MSPSPEHASCHVGTELVVSHHGGYHSNLHYWGDSSKSDSSGGLLTQYTTSSRLTNVQRDAQVSIQVPSDPGKNGIYRK